ncbi:5-formyltetrahydrofolate cyclo-ligase [Caenispirillum salinarum]|uniref:5-formyltetrahydrofolate cyclo-ligase n=1 Tax=Caenispirillum salinarum TaxID=859058 RepID=UPI00384D873C
MTADLAETKKRLRAECLARRPAVAEQAGRGRAGLGLRDVVTKHWHIGPQSVVAGFWPMREEIDVLPLLTAVVEAGATAALPVVGARDAALTFRRWHPGMALEDGVFGTRHPRSDAGEVTPSVVLVPLVAFDRAGGRLGYGGGFYDRTLAALRVDTDILSIGVAYAGQELPQVPEEAHDEPLDWIATERGIIVVNRRKEKA